MIDPAMQRGPLTIEEMKRMQPADSFRYDPRAVNALPRCPYDATETTEQRQERLLREMRRENDLLLAVVFFTGLIIGAWGATLFR